MKLLFFTTIIFFFAIPTERKTFNDNEHIKVELIFPTKIRQFDTSQKLQFHFSPNNGIHVNTDPSIEFVIDKKSEFEVVGEPSVKKNKKGYLAITKPVEVSFKAKKNTPPGKYPLKGSLRYFFCSDKDGWCNRHSQDVELIIEITK